jgi:ERCC3/RAD25/XPB C-terminal helicase
VDVHADTRPGYTIRIRCTVGALQEAPNRRIALAVMNPVKFAACEFLVRYHEQTRRDKVIVFSDNIFALKEYATRLRRPYIFGGTSHAERTKVLSMFKHSSEINTVRDRHLMIAAWSASRRPRRPARARQRLVISARIPACVPHVPALLFPPRAVAASELPLERYVQLAIVCARRVLLCRLGDNSLDVLKAQELTQLARRSS